MITLSPPVSRSSRLFQLATEGLPRTYWLLWGGMLVNRLGGFVLTLLNTWLTLDRGLSLQTAGVIIAVFGVGSMLGNITGGAMADRIGRRRTLMMGLGSNAIAMVLFSFAREPEFLAPAALLVGFSLDFGRPASNALIADVVAPEYRLKAFNTYYWAINLGFAGAAVLGGTLATHNYSLAFYLDAATTLAFGVLVFLFIPETRPQPKEGAANDGSFLTPILDKTFGPFLLLVFLTVLMFAQHQVALPTSMFAHGMTPADFGIALGFNGVLIVLLQPWLTALMKRWPRPMTLAVSSVFVGAGFGLNAFASTLPHFMGTVAVWTIGEILMAGTNSSLVSDLSPTHLRGRYQGAFSLAWSTAMVVAPLGSPWAIKALTMNRWWLVIGALGLVVAAGHLLLAPRRKARLVELGVGAGLRD